jgi:urea transporter
MTITEPMTLLTDYLLAALVFYFAFRLFHAAGRSGQSSVRWWATAFAFSALAGVTGGTYHGFHSQLGAAVGLGLWKVTVYAIGIAGLSLLFGAALSSLRRSLRLWVLAAAILEFLVYAVWMANHNDFRFVIYDYAPVLVVVLFLQFLRLGREKSAPWILGGILLSFAAAGVQASGFDPAPNFNHNDLYHLVQMGAFYLLYRGGRLLRDREG